MKKQALDDAKALLESAEEELATVKTKYTQELAKLKEREAALADARKRAESANTERVKALLAAADGDGAAAKKADKLRPDVVAARLAAEDEEAILDPLRARVAALEAQVGMAARAIPRAEFRIRAAMMVTAAERWDAAVAQLISVTGEIVDFATEAEQFALTLNVSHVLDPITRTQRILGRVINRELGRVPMLSREIPSTVAAPASRIRGTLAEQLGRDFLDLPGNIRALDLAVKEGPHTFIWAPAVDKADEGDQGSGEAA